MGQQQALPLLLQQRIQLAIADVMLLSDTLDPLANQADVLFIGG